MKKSRRLVKVIVPKNESIYYNFCENNCIDNGEIPVSHWDGIERVAFYCDLGMTDDMDKKFERAKEGRYEIRWLPDYLWEEYKNVMGKDIKRVIKI